MEKYLFTIKNYENNKLIEEMMVLNYQDCGVTYWLEFDNGFGSISKERVLKIEKIIEY